jgi:phenylalanyl-tRNA synthetase alpha chain
VEERDLHPLESKLLAHLAAEGPSWDDEIVSRAVLPDEGSFRRAAQWLLSRGMVVETRRSERSIVTPGPLAMEALSAGCTPEIALLDAARAGAAFSAVQADGRFDPARWGSALGALTRAGLVRRGEDGTLSAPGDGRGLFGTLWDLVYAPLSEGLEVVLEDLPAPVAEMVADRSPRRGRGRAEFTVSSSVRVELDLTPEGREAWRAESGTGATGQLTPAMLSDGSWREARFRRYSMDIPAARIHCGRLHPYRVFLDAVRRKFVSLGFTEMEGPVAESEFWNCDALFMPQFHPARDIHDAYYVDRSAGRLDPDPELLERVAEVHTSGGGTGGRGWGYEFDAARAGTVVMRSQGTALSARCLASGPSVPGRYFAMARCFRYDQVDATHLPDFFQIEGIVLEEGISLRHLVGLLEMFAVKIAGASEYRLQPSYFPFTEPSVEMHIRHPRIGWMEMGGAGLFRPEVTEPLGISVPVIAWGLGLDRMAMTAMGLSDIRDLVTGDLARLREMRVRPERMPGGGGGTGDAQDRG